MAGSKKVGTPTGAVTPLGDKLVVGVSHDAAKPAVYGENAAGGTAGKFVGDVLITGNLEVEGDIFVPGADCAEQFEVAQPEQIAPGTVVVIDPSGALRESDEAYDRKVAGVVAGAGQYRPGIILDGGRSGGGKLPVALVGKVYCQVDAQYAPVGVGDLLTTSPTPSHAMKVEDPLQAVGAVIGKALGSLPAGKALVPILVCLQ